MTDCLSSPGTNLAFEADFGNLPAQLRGRKLGVSTATTLEFDQTIGKWCLKNLTGSKSFDHQLESSVIEVGNNNNLGCLRHVIKCEYSVKSDIFLSLILFSSTLTSHLTSRSHISLVTMSHLTFNIKHLSFLLHLSYLTYILTFSHL